MGSRLRTRSGPWPTGRRSVPGSGCCGRGWRPGTARTPPGTPRRRSPPGRTDGTSGNLPGVCGAWGNSGNLPGLGRFDSFPGQHARDGRTQVTGKARIHELRTWLDGAPDIPRAVLERQTRRLLGAALVAANMSGAVLVLVFATVVFPDPP